MIAEPVTVDDDGVTVRTQGVPSVTTALDRSAEFVNVAVKVMPAGVTVPRSQFQ